MPLGNRYLRVPLLVATTLLALGIVAPSGAAISPPESELVAIRDLRRQAQWTDAMAKADSLERATRKQHDLQGWLRRSIELYLETMTFCASLSVSDSAAIIAADSLYHEAIALKDASDYPQAEAAARRALSLRSSLLGPRHFESIEACNTLAEIVRRRGRRAEADSLLGFAQRAAEEVVGPDHPLVAAILDTQGWSFINQSRFDEAERLLLRALEICRFSHRPDHPDYFTAYTSLSGLYTRTGQFARAEAMLRQALDVCETNWGKVSNNYALVMNDLGNIRLKGGRPEECLAFFQAALETWSAVLDPDHAYLGYATNNVGVTCRQLGRLTEAERLLQRSLAIRLARYGPDHFAVVSVRANLAMAYVDMGRSDEAAEQIGLALEILERTGTEPSLKYEKILITAATVSKNAGRYAEAEVYLRQAIDVYEQVARGSEAPSFGVLGLYRNFVETCAFDRADSLYAAVAADLGTMRQQQPKLYLVYHRNRVRSLRMRGRHDETISLLDELVREFPVEELEGVHTYVFHEELAKENLLAGHDQEAAAWAAEACLNYEQHEAAMGEGVAQALRFAPPHFIHAVALLRTGQHEEAWRQIQEGSFRNLTRELRKNSDLQADSELRAALDSLRTEAGRLAEELDSARSGNQDTVALESRFLSANLALLSARDSLRNRSGDGLVVSPDHVAELSRRNGPTALLGWVHVDFGADQSAVWGYVVRPDGSMIFRDLSAGEPVLAAARYRARLVSASTWPHRVAVNPNDDQASHLVFETWVQAMLRELDDDPAALLVVPAGPLLGIPIESLRDESGQYLGDRFPITYTPSLSVYRTLDQRRQGQSPNPLRRALLVGDPLQPEARFAGSGQEAATRDAALSTGDRILAQEATVRSGDDLDSLADLPWTRREVTEIAAYADEAVVLLGADASERRIMELAREKELKTFSTIHFASHSVLAEDSPHASAIVLSQVGLRDPAAAILAGERIEDGLLTAQEISEELDLDASLVVLGACQTGLGELSRGEGYLGLVYALLDAGAHSVVSSLWKINDHATYLFMTGFYEYLATAYREDSASPMVKAQAIRAAQRRVRGHVDEYGSRPFEHPVYWAGLTLVGLAD